MSETPSSAPLELYTIGHSNVPLNDLLGLLHKFGIQILVDVRSSPYSRFVPQYNRESLKQSLEQAGVDYRFAGDYLGGRPKDPSFYKHGVIAETKADYLHEVDYPAVMTRDFFQTGIQQLMKIAATGRTAILCSEEDSARCHRHHLIGRYLIGQGVSVLHIRHDGSLVRDQQLPDLDQGQKAAQLTPSQRSNLLRTLQARFEQYLPRHPGLHWAEVQTRLEASPARLWSLSEMERTGGEPDVVAQDPQTGEYIFYDCSAESPLGRRSLCYDRAALDARKTNKPPGSALEMAAALGVQLLTEEEYRALQQLGEFDLKSSSWVMTPASIRQLGGALFMDRRYNAVFLYHNGADSYYAARGFRGSLRT